MTNINSTPRVPSPRPHGPVRKAINAVAELGGSLVLGATAALPGALVGGLYAAELNKPEDQRHRRELGALLHATTSMASATLGSLMWTGSTGNYGLSLNKVAVTGAEAGWQYHSGASSVIAERIYGKLDHLSAESPEESKLQVLRQGAWQGLVEGTKGGAEEGRQEARGLIEGLIESWKDGSQALKGHWDMPTGIGAAEPANLLERGVGGVGRLMGATLGAVDGAIQGAFAGVMDVAPEKVRATLNAMTAGAVAGGAVLGPLGAVTGAALTKLYSLTDSLGAEHTAQALERSFENNPDLGHPIANKYRNTIEGAVVGGVTGARNGGSRGYQSALQWVRS